MEKADQNYIDSQRAIVKKNYLTAFDITLTTAKNVAKIFGSLILTPISPILANVALALSAVSIVKTTYKLGDKLVLSDRNSKILTEIAMDNNVNEEDLRFVNIKTKKSSRPGFAQPGNYIEYSKYAKMPPEEKALYVGVIVPKDKVRLTKMILLLKKNEKTKLGRQLADLRKEIKINGYSLSKETNLQPAKSNTNEIGLNISNQASDNNN